MGRKVRGGRNKKKTLLRLKQRRFDLAIPRKHPFSNGVKTKMGWWNWAPIRNVTVECETVACLANGNIVVRHKPSMFNAGWGPTGSRCYSLITKNGLCVADYTLNGVIQAAKEDLTEDRFLKDKPIECVFALQ